MSGNKPVALQLADTAHLGYQVGWQRSVKAELLRQHSEIERLTAERDEAARIAGAYSPARELQRSLDQSKATNIETKKERDAAIRERDALRAELEALRAQESASRPGRTSHADPRRRDPDGEAGRRVSRW